MTEFTDYFLLILFQLTILPILYAETHYRFKYFFSYLKKREPEIIADIPSRITSGSIIPVLIIIKDADRYPVLIKEISVIDAGREIFSKKLNINITAPYEDLLFDINSDSLSYGQHYFEIRIRYRVNNKERVCKSDNYRGTGHSPLPIYISRDPLPRFENCYFGETHAHTNYTSDQVEFGASLKSTKVMARAIGLNFFAATDHSYDLDDYQDNYLENDPELKKWHNFKDEVAKKNKDQKDFIIIPGEEVTVQNKNAKNVHLLIFNSEQFFPGSGDSGEKWFKNSSELSISQVISNLKETTLAISAHPSETPPFLQKLFINRGSWQSEDCAEPGLNGLQFINGGDNLFIENGKNLWIEQLLRGNRLTGLAGNDAHGNFSRFRQVRFPFFTMRENYKHLFGKWRTGIYIDNHPFNIRSILDNIRIGNCFMTNGPALAIEVYDKTRGYKMGEQCISPAHCRVEAQSTEEFGNLSSIEIISGDLHTKRESVLYKEIIDHNSFIYSQKVILNNLPVKGYLRIEVRTEKYYQALSNPIWF